MVRRIIPYIMGRRIRSLDDTSYRFESCSDYSSYLIPGSTVTTIGEFGISHEWGRKISGTYNNGVPKHWKRSVGVIVR